MIKGLLLIVTMGVISFIYTDINSSNGFFRIFLPFVAFLSFIALAIWFVVLFHNNGVSQISNSSGGDSSGFGDFDGDGGD